MAKLRGNPIPEPSYTPDVAGLLRWLRQPPGQWSALGWQNAPAWADEIRDLVAERDAAAAERDEAVAERDQAIAERDDAVDQLDEAVAERDEARRDLCIRESLARTTHYMGTHGYPCSSGPSAMCVAKEYGWNCFDGIKEVRHG
jgi:hypothetical protein